MTDAPPPFETTAERDRYWAGRHDWREHEWEDHCGDPTCEEPCCARNYIPTTKRRPAPTSFGLTEGLV